MKLRTANARITILAVAMVLSACAANKNLSNAASDPWEGMNRGIYAFNDVGDRILLKPIAKGYKKIIPQFARTGVGNFYDNLTTPRSAINNFLQGKAGRGFKDIGRFLFNSTIGIGGLFDVASSSGMDEYDEDFGQTLAVWGVSDGPYVMLPFLGPRTLRDAVMLPFDSAAHPLYYYENSSVRDKLHILQVIDLRASLLSAESLIEDSKDKYITIRESYLQNREFEIYDGDPPVDEDFYDDFEDFEDDDNDQR